MDKLARKNKSNSSSATISNSVNSIKNIDKSIKKPISSHIVFDSSSDDGDNDDDDDEKEDSNRNNDTDLTDSISKVVIRKRSRENAIDGNDKLKKKIRTG